MQMNIFYVFSRAFLYSYGSFSFFFCSFYLFLKCTLVAKVTAVGGGAAPLSLILTIVSIRQLNKLGDTLSHPSCTHSFTTALSPVSACLHVCVLTMYFRTHSDHYSPVIFQIAHFNKKTFFCLLVQSQSNLTVFKKCFNVPCIYLYLLKGSEV